MSTGCLPGVLALAPDQTILPVAPMFHINDWCIPCAAPYRHHGRAVAGLLRFLVLKPGQVVTKDEILAFASERVPKRWIPNDVVFLNALPVGGTGKAQKGDLRKQHGGVFS